MKMFFVIVVLLISNNNFPQSVRIIKFDNRCTNSHAFFVGVPCGLHGNVTYSNGLLCILRLRVCSIPKSICDVTVL